MSRSPMPVMTSVVGIHSLPLRAAVCCFSVQTWGIADRVFRHFTQWSWHQTMYHIVLGTKLTVSVGLNLACVYLTIAEANSKMCLYLGSSKEMSSSTVDTAFSFLSFSSLCAAALSIISIGTSGRFDMSIDAQWVQRRNALSMWNCLLVNSAE